MIKSVTPHNQVFGGSSPPKPECTPAHPDAFVLGWFEGLICSAATGAGMTPSTDPTAKGQLGDFQKFIDDVSKATSSDGKGTLPSPWVILVGALVIILVLRRL